MQIQIKQPELEQILRSHLGAMGIHCITGMGFTATRGGDGIVTDIEVGLPGTALTASALVTQEPVATFVATPTLVPAASVAAGPETHAQVPQTTATVSPFAATDSAGAIPKVVDDTEASPKTTGKNLFG